jgi:hypothetical protein
VTHLWPRSRFFGDHHHAGTEPVSQPV